VDASEAVHQLDPLAGLEHRVELAGVVGAGLVGRLVADVDVVGVIGQRERVAGNKGQVG
jgi:hypothetical protein